MKKQFAITFAISMAMSMTIGLSAFAAENETNVSVSIQQKKPEKRGIMAKVTAIDGTVLTVTLAERPEGITSPEKPESEEGITPPEKPEDEEGMTPPEKPESEEGMTPPQKPESEEGMMPPQKPKREQMNFTGESITISLEDDIIVDLGNGETGSIEDIAVDDVIRIIYDDSETTIKSIFVKDETKLPQMIPETEE
ncbi:MAG TPA: hypothetical protein IAB62_04125 [Candidatus Coprocola pullicola]|nr:hypothetical protein [Candidatus Coprocola pullicola]